jgi:hypothetical protein
MRLTRRLAHGLRRHGPIGAIRHGARLAFELAYLSEAHIWYRLDLPGVIGSGLPDGFEIAAPGAAALALLSRLPTLGPNEAREHLAGGGTWWLVTKDGTPVFSCWLFERRTPAIAAPQHWLPLPPGVVCLENSVASPDFRGLGIAPKTWGLLAGRLAADGKQVLVTKVEVENVASRRAVEKAGFQEIARMDYTRRRFRGTVRVEPIVEGDAFVAHLQRVLCEQGPFR